MKRKLNYIDYSIIIIVLAVALVLGKKISNVTSNKSSANKEINNTKKQVILEITDVREYSVKAISPGDNLYSGDTNYFFGKITDIEVEESYLPIIKHDGESVLTRSPERYNIKLFVDCNILDRANGVFAEGITEIKVNSVGKYKTIGLLFTAITESIGE